MIEWLKGKFAAVVTIFYFLTFIAFGIGGAMTGKMLLVNGLGLVLGFAVGGLLGMFIGILTLGFFATVINISDTCDLIYEKLNEMSSNSSSNSSYASKSSGFSSSVVNSSEPESYKICKKCGAKNPANSTTCKDCGEYL